jgi:hypothetical protein
LPSNAAGRVLRSLPWLSAAAMSSACNRLDAIPYSPAQTPESWLLIQPFLRLEIGSFRVLFMQPSTSIIVYLLGLLAIGLGVYFLRIRHGQHTRLWWGIAMLLWGAGALLAGTSYEAFSHAIKCEGRAACVWTSWWEVIYLIVTVASVDAILIAQTYACVVGPWRRALWIYALANAGAYLVVALIGAFVPVKLLISFELMLAFVAPTIAGFVLLNGRRYLQRRGAMDLALLGAWLWLGLTLGAYALYLTLGITDRLWARGIWFSENDVLHVGLILWMIYLARFVANRVEDAGGPMWASA